MESAKKWLSERTSKKNGLYVHYSPPKYVGTVTTAELRRWAAAGRDARLERALLAGHGRRLLAEAGDRAPAMLAAMQARCEALHAAVERGSLLQLQELLDTEYNGRKFSNCRDEAGVGLLHKAVFYNYTDIVHYLVSNYPQLVHQRDSDGRTPLHYAAVSRDEAEIAAVLDAAGAVRAARDAAGHTPAYYRGQARSTLNLPIAEPGPDGKDQGLVVKRHNIRIWCHDCDMARLQRVVWEGHGAKLLSEVSNQPIVKKFLEAVPYIMNTIRDIHNAVVQNDLEGVMRLTSDPVPPQALSSRDTHNMTVMHKAAGLGHVSILKYLAERYPLGINDVDNDGRTPLHYAATFRDEQHTYNTLLGLGADESIVDNKNKKPGFYINRPQDIDKNIFKTIPEAPRTPSSAYPSSWDWNMLHTEMIAEFNKKTKRKHLKASNDSISAKNNTNTISENTQSNSNVMKNSSTQDHIESLPELNDTHRANENGIELYDLENNKEKDADNELKEPDHEKITENDLENDDSNKSHHEENQNDNETTNDETCETETGYTENNESEDKQDDQNYKIADDSIPSNTEENDHNENVHDGEAKNDDRNHKDQISNRDNFTNTNGENERKLENEETHDIDKKEEREENEKNPLESNHNEQPDSNKNEELTEFHEEQSLSVAKENSEQAEEDAINVAEPGIHTNEGNNNSDPTEDDDDVQVHGDTQSEYSDTYLKSTAEASSNPGSAEREYKTTDEGRNTQQSLIEGIINGQAEEDYQDAGVQREGSIEGDIFIVDNEIDPEITELINSTNMEMLATLVLNGEGSRLVGRRSVNLELQAFLDNVPTYMQKISKVHEAAREGNIRDLQAALDRRKFAIARDLTSPNGATPLHVATIFGKTNIMKYLGGRFPETLSAVDFEGRTALHYAAALPDNGHYYNLLQQLGANAKDLDDNGKSAEDYLNYPDLLPFEQLLTDFGISHEAAQQMLSDKVFEDRVSSRRNLDTPDVLDTLERCYGLLASAKLPRTPLSASSNKATPPLVLGRFLKRHIFDAIKTRTTKLDHDLFDVIWPAVKKLPESRNIIQTVEEDFPGGVTAPDYYVYEVFAEFLIPLIKDLHNINVNSELPAHPKSDFIKSETPSEKNNKLDLAEELNIDQSDEFILSGTIECSRNLFGFELPMNLKIGELETIERIVTTVLMQLDFIIFNSKSSSDSEQKGGTYYTLNEVLEKPSEICATLASSGLLVALCDSQEIDDSTRLHGRHWPYGRGVFVTEDKSIAIWINVHDHLRVLTSTPADAPGEIGVAFSRLTNIMIYLHQRLDFVWHPTFGHLSARPTFLGSGIRFNFIINFPGLSKDLDNMKHLCAMRGLQYRETLTSDIARVSNYQCLGLTESNCFNDFATATSNLLHLEQDMSMQNSAHIATLLSNIFKRKRSSLADLDNPENH